MKCAFGSFSLFLSLSLHACKCFGFVFVMFQMCMCACVQIIKANAIKSFNPIPATLASHLPTHTHAHSHHLSNMLFAFILPKCCTRRRKLNVNRAISCPFKCSPFSKCCSFVRAFHFVCTHHTFIALRCIALHCIEFCMCHT